MTHQELHQLEEYAVEQLRDLTDGLPTLTPYGRALLRQSKRLKLISLRAGIPIQAQISGFGI